ncbi:MAG: hypothetical protein HN742_02200 [Lentisphaerae bacterium]|jgi:MFS family permease|nr:hypothetical protein [Lentisphaerota bacterium]MBT5610671.1 hypothetical protein [Lentisphaerota bacterium]MBT7058027.1 hypothetical protein [Lentisphaerota bacterium]MBT7840649.1 hypothetical protein [Lentisphaerota bacterium]
MPLFHLPTMRRHERATLNYSYAGEFGRGAFMALCRDFALLVAVTHFGVTNRWLLWIISSASFAGFLLALSSSSLSSRWRKKSVIRTIEVVARLLVLAAALAFGGTSFVVLMGAGIAIGTLSVPLVSGIYGANFSTDVRGHAVGRLQAISVGTSALTGLLLGTVMDVSTSFYRPLLAVVAGVSLGCAWYTWRLPESKRGMAEAEGQGLKAAAQVMVHDRPFMYLELVWFILGLSNLWLNPIRILHLAEMGFSKGQIMFATTTVGYTSMVLATGLWGRLLYRMNFAVYRALTVLLFMIGIIIFFHSKSFPVICFASALWATGLAGGGLSWRLVATFFARRAQVPTYMSVHTFLCGIRGVLGPFLSLQLHQTHDTVFISHLSLIGMGISVLMLIPLAPVIAKRRTAVESRSDTVLDE